MQPIEQVTPQQLLAQAEQWRPQLLAFARDLIRTPSPTGDEKSLADRLVERMNELGFDEAFIDGMGNCIGRIRGNGTGPTVLFTAPLDTVEPGDRASWAHDPLAAEVVDGWLHGLGASDNKGALAAMVYAGAMLKHLGVPLAGDFLLAGVVQSHANAALGMRYLADRALPERGLQYDLVVLGNPTNLDLYLGHRGRVEIEVNTIGRTCHAGAPWLGSNAVYKMVPVIQAVQALATTLPSHPFLEKSTLALTNIHGAPGTSATIPDRATITLDRRFLPSESPDEVVWQVQSILNRLSAQDGEFKGETHVRQASEPSYTGESHAAAQLLHPFVTDASHALVADTAAALGALGQTPRFGKWSFTTDGGYTATIKNIVTLGYAPGDEKFAQTPFERVGVDQLIQAAAGYAAISQKISG